MTFHRHALNRPGSFPSNLGGLSKERDSNLTDWSFCLCLLLLLLLGRPATQPKRPAEDRHHLPPQRRLLLAAAATGLASSLTKSQGKFTLLQRGRSGVAPVLNVGDVLPVKEKLPPADALTEDFSIDVSPRE